MSASLWFSRVLVCALFLGKRVPIGNCAIYHSGVQSQFTGPSDGICPGDGVIFTCALNSTALSTTWTVTSGGVASSCTYNQNMPETQKCGPSLKFTSSQTDVDGDSNNSSLSVDSVDTSLNGVSVRCADGTGVIIGSRAICVIGKTECHCISYKAQAIQRHRLIYR